jgi:hypothetical protein
MVQPLSCKQSTLSSKMEMQMLMEALTQQGGGDPQKREVKPDPYFGTDPLDNVAELSQGADANKEFDTQRLVEMLMQMLMGGGGR